MNPIAGTTVFVLCLVVIAAPRRWALVAMAAGLLYLTYGAAVHIFGLNIFPQRFLEVAGMARVLLRRELRFTDLNGIDRAWLLLYGYGTAVFLLRSPDGQAYQIGVAVDAYLGYFTFRGLIRNLDEFRSFLRSFALLLIPFAAIVMEESFTHRNLFTLVGAPVGTDDMDTWSREGRVRCFGSFRHPSLLGTIGVCFIPLYIGMAFAAADRARAVVGIVLCAMIVWASNSGGPLSALAVGVVAWLCWRLRTRMQRVRWGIVVMIVMAALLMKAPVWYLIAHVSAITGGTGWHRAFLLDTTWRHLSVWWLAGMPIKDTAGWFAYDLAATGGADVTNAFVEFGLTSGLGAVVLFIVLLTRAYRAVGKRAAFLRSVSAEPGEDEYLAWGMGCMLTAHIANWFGITYFDQTYLLWVLQLAAIAAVSVNYSEVALTTEDEAIPAPLDSGTLAT